MVMRIQWRQHLEPRPDRRSDGAIRHGRAESDSAAGQCPRRRSSSGEDAELAMRAEIVFEIYFGIAKWQRVLLEHRVYLETSLELKEPADLSLRQGADAIPLNGDRLEQTSRDVVPSTSERGRHIFG